MPPDDPRIDKKLFMMRKSEKLITKLFSDYIAKFVYNARNYLFGIYLLLVIFNTWNIFAHLEPSSRNMEVLKSSNGLRRFNDWSKYELWDDGRVGSQFNFGIVPRLI